MTLERAFASLMIAIAGACGATGTPSDGSPGTSSSSSPAGSSAAVSVSADPSSLPKAPAVVVGHARTRPTTKAEAIAAFQSAWTEEIVPSTVERRHPDVAQFSSSVLDAKKIRARLGPCRVAHHRVDDTLGGTERTDFVFFSAIGALDRDGDCWEVEVPTGAFNVILGYVDPETGALLFAWLVPEG